MPSRHRCRAIAAFLTGLALCAVIAAPATAAPPTLPSAEGVTLTQLQARAVCEALQDGGAAR